MKQFLAIIIWLLVFGGFYLSLSLIPSSLFYKDSNDIKDGKGDQMIVHPIRQGLGYSHENLKNNLKLLNSYEKKKKSYKLIQKMKHNSSLFTQGLVFLDGQLLESTGLYGQSEIIKIDQKSGKRSLQSDIMTKEYFGEGIAVIKNETIVQLTWQEFTGFVYKIPSLPSSTSTSPIKIPTPISQFTYETFTGEGWGITYNPDKHELIVSDGSEYLFFWDADSFQEKRYLRVTLPPCLSGSGGREEGTTDSTGTTRTGSSQQKHAKDKPLRKDIYCKTLPPQENNNENDKNENKDHNHIEKDVNPKRYLKFLNELEYVNGYVYANVWYSNDIVKIDINHGGVVIDVYDFNAIHKHRSKKEDCFNGIAYDKVANQFYVTGKLWPYMFKVELDDAV
mmetsp:Transcript_6237/g.8048  ORF Transcript_6237/g.8048 Transcript_6237/m.8048 type:complete len:392 (+) Transcript_6237:186-1361(+)